MKAIEREALTQVELDQVLDQGFLIKRGLISPEQICKISSEIDSLHEQLPASASNVAWEKLEPGKPRRIKQLMHSEKVSPGLDQVLRSDEVLDIVEAIIGHDISLFHSKLLMKAARDGSVTPWHQDYAYWVKGMNRPLQLNCMLAIDRQTRENGCIQFVPGTQKQGLIKHEKRENESFGIFLPGHFYQRPDAVYVELEPGDCVFFGPLVIHGSDGNHSALHRRANTVAYTVTGDDPSQCREVLRGRGL